jgi:hypothetical protein
MAAVVVERIRSLFRAGGNKLRRTGKHSPYCANSEAARQHRQFPQFQESD